MCDKTDPYTSLSALIDKHDQELKDILDRAESLYVLKVLAFEERITDLNNRLAQRRGSLGELETELQQMRGERAKIEDQIARYRQELVAVLGEIGTAKENLVLKRFGELEQEIKKIIQIHEQLESSQNARFQSEYHEDKETDRERIGLYKKIEHNLKETYDDVNGRIRALNASGINASVSALLTTTGWVAAFVAGWFFSLWAEGPQEPSNTTNIGGNDSVRFALINLLAKFTLRYTWWELLTGLLVYMLMISVTSWLGHYLLIRFGFIEDRKKREDLRKQAENDEDFKLSPEEQDDMFKGRFSANTWFALWLKMAPFFIFFYLTLAVIAKEAIREQTVVREENGVKVQIREVSNELQQLFDSLTNQFMGTLLAVVFAGLVVLYISKVIEPRYIRRAAAGNENASHTWEVITGLTLFVVLVLSCVLHYYRVPPFKDITMVAITGFLVCCMTTGFALGYGYRYSSLEEIHHRLTYSLETIAIIINRLSKPKRYNFKDNELFLQRVALLQSQMLSFVEDKNQLTHQVAGMGRRVVIVKEAPHQDGKKGAENSGDQPGDPENGAREDEKETARPVARQWPFKWPILFEKTLHLAAASLLNLFRKRKEKPRSAADAPSKLTYNEEVYFPELAGQMQGINLLMAAELDKLRTVELGIDDYWKNEGTYRSLNDQIKHIQEEIVQRKNEVLALSENHHNQTTELKYEGERQKTLIREGFYTSLWFLKNGDDLKDPLLKSSHQ